jgi:uncharacterized sulfatase
MLTGTYPSKNGVGQYLENFPTIMEVLRSVGYRSLVVTDNPFVQLLCNQADDRIFVTEDQVARMSRSRDVSILLEMVGSALLHKSTHLRSFAPNYLKNKLAKNWINRNRESAPWFTMIHYDVHWPYDPPRDFRDQFLDSALRKRAGTVRSEVYELIAGDLKDKIKVLKSLYDGQIAWVDACIGDLLNQMKSQSIFDDTITIVTSDHGDLLGEHGLLHHEFVLYEPLIRVPFIVRIPGKFREGRRNDSLVQTVDILPTLVDYFGIDRPVITQQIQGKSLLKIVDSADHRDFTISERADWSSPTSRRKLDNLSQKYPSYDWKKHAHELVAVRTEDKKYLWSSEGRDELYDLQTDPQELTNLIAVEDATRRELRNKLDMWNSSFLRAPIGDDKFESVITKKLKALGYL